MACFRCNTTKNFIFLLEYRQRNVYLGTSKKSLVFVTIRHLRKDAAFLHFRLKENVIIYMPQNHTKTNENMNFPALFANFYKAKILFFMQ